MNDDVPPELRELHKFSKNWERRLFWENILLLWVLPIAVAAAVCIAWYDWTLGLTMFAFYTMGWMACKYVISSGNYRDKMRQLPDLDEITKDWTPEQWREARRRFGLSDD